MQPETQRRRLALTAVSTHPNPSCALSQPNHSQPEEV